MSTDEKDLLCRSFWIDEMETDFEDESLAEEKQNFFRKDAWEA